MAGNEIVGLLIVGWCLCLSRGSQTEPRAVNNIIVYTVATSENDGLARFLRSAKLFNINVQVLGSGQEWKGGNVRRFAGGGQKVNFLREAFKHHHYDAKTVLIFVDSYDVIFTATTEEIVKRFLNMGFDILFSAEPYCWPDKSLANDYPVVRSGKRYLNSGGFMGFADALERMFESAPAIADDEDDQLFYTNLYLNSRMREKFNMGLDSTSRIFQNLNGATDEIELKFKSDGNSLVKNIAYGTIPCVLHGNGASKTYLNYLSNYVPKVWSSKAGCLVCAEQTLNLDGLQKLPTIFVAMFIEKETPFFQEFIERIMNLNYPREYITLFIHNTQPSHTKIVEDTLGAYGTDYKSVISLSPDDNISERNARNEALKRAKELNMNYHFVVDSEAQLTNADTLKLLLEQNRPILAPLLVRPNKLWANFWGALNDHGYYARSPDYVELVQSSRMSVWNVPYIATSYLIHSDLFDALQGAYSYNMQVDADMSFCQYCRDHEHFLYVSNMHAFGHLVNSDNYDSKRVHPELYELFDNKIDWEQRYLHKDYETVLKSNELIEEPCTDVYWYPIFSERFCLELIETMEAFGKWSDGSNSDHRLQGGYENVPTRDIHMNQVGLERHWLHILDQYFRPIQEKLYVGYFHQPPSAIMNFVVRYRPDEQPALRPHHDASTYTVNINLNRPGIDYEGGGARFMRYNCSVVGLRQGWALMHPGRLTHMHEGLPTTSGTRYIMVSFVDP